MIQQESLYTNYDPTPIQVTDTSTLSYWFLFAGTKLLISESTHSPQIPYERQIRELGILPLRTQNIGSLHGSPCHCGTIDETVPLPEGINLYEMRGLYYVLGESVFLVAGRALQVMTWDMNHQYCSRCGHLVDQMQTELTKKCPSCGLTNHPIISPAVITAIIKNNQILLARNVSFYRNIHSLIAGFVETGETLEECVEREIKEEVGLNVKNIRYIGSQPWPFPHSLMIGFIADYESGDIAIDGVEICEANWFSVDNLPEIPPRLSIARKIIDWYIEEFS